MLCGSVHGPKQPRWKFAPRSATTRLCIVNAVTMTTTVAMTPTIVVN